MLREIAAMNNLNDKHVVRYFNCWLEKTPKEERKIEKDRILKKFNTNRFSKRLKPLKKEEEIES